MIKILATAALVASLTLGSIQSSHAGDREAEIIGGIVGGVIGGIILDRALRKSESKHQQQHHHHHYYEYERHRNHRNYRQYDNDKDYLCTSFPHGWDRNSHYIRCRNIR